MIQLGKTNISLKSGISEKFQRLQSIYFDRLARCIQHSNIDDVKDIVARDFGIFIAAISKIVDQNSDQTTIAKDLVEAFSTFQKKSKLTGVTDPYSFLQACGALPTGEKISNKSIMNYYYGEKIDFHMDQFKSTDEKHLGTKDFHLCEIINATQDLAKNIALKYSEKADLEDLVQSAVEGVIVAANGFDPSKGTKFSTYAQYHIVRSMQAESSSNLPIKLKQIHSTILSEKKGIEHGFDTGRFILQPSPLGETMNLIDVKDGTIFCDFTQDEFETFAYGILTRDRYDPDDTDQVIFGDTVYKIHCNGSMIPEKLETVLTLFKRMKMRGNSVSMNTIRAIIESGSSVASLDQQISGGEGESGVGGSSIGDMIASEEDQYSDFHTQHDFEKIMEIVSDVMKNEDEAHRQLFKKIFDISLDASDTSAENIDRLISVRLVEDRNKQALRYEEKKMSRKIARGITAKFHDRNILYKSDSGYSIKGMEDAFGYHDTVEGISDRMSDFILNSISR